MTLYSDYTQIGNDKYYNRDLEARQALNNLGALAAKNQAALATDVSGVLPIANGGTGANNEATARYNLDVVKTSSRYEIYVSTSGNDTTGDGTQNKPFRTISKAIQYAPYLINQTINIASGTYNENVTINNHKDIVFNISGNVTISGSTSTSADVIYLRRSSLGFMFEPNAKLTIINPNSNSNVGCIAAGYDSCIYTISSDATSLLELQQTGNNGYGISMMRGSYLGSYGSQTQIKLINCTIGIAGMYGGRIALYKVIGTATKAFHIDASLLHIADYSGITASTMFATYNGGRIYSAAQTSAPNY